MPFLTITTNTKINNHQDVSERASKFTASLLNKPESYVMVKILSEQPLLFAGTNEPAAHVKLKSLGLPENNTTELSSKICSFIKTQFNINSERIYIEFTNPERHMWGWDKTTF
ncbi:MAG: hypothetical protein COB77_00440 [Gammaproteobacteria bacterium]|nr:MAG: hypothetical protein COB77_00440 [Gammaproteobacteria bacterium]